MFNLEALDLARIQFAFTVSFHIIFPAITIGLASFLAVLEGLWLKTHNDTYRDLYHFWSKIFAVNFGMGVVSGLVMAYGSSPAARWTGWHRFRCFAVSVWSSLTHCWAAPGCWSRPRACWNRGCACSPDLWPGCCWR